METSLAMRALQKTKLHPSSQKGGWELLWHDSIDNIPLGSGEYTMLLAHEFFDALPIHVLEVKVLPHVSCFLTCNTLIRRKPLKVGRKSWSRLLRIPSPSSLQLPTCHTPRLNPHTHVFGVSCHQVPQPHQLSSAFRLLASKISP